MTPLLTGTVAAACRVLNAVMRAGGSPKRHVAAAFYSVLLQSPSCPVDLVDALTYSGFMQVIKVSSLTWNDFN